MSLLDVAANLIQRVVFREDNDGQLSELASEGVRLRDRIRELEGSEKGLRFQVDNAVAEVESRVLDMLTLSLALTGSQETIDVKEMLLRIETLKGDAKQLPDMLLRVETLKEDVQHLTDANDRLREEVGQLSTEIENLKDRKSLGTALDVLKTRTMKARQQRTSTKPRAARGKGKK